MWVKIGVWHWPLAAHSISPRPFPMGRGTLSILSEGPQPANKGGLGWGLRAPARRPAQAPCPSGGGPDGTQTVTPPPPGDGDSSHACVHTSPAGSHVCAPRSPASASGALAPASHPVGTRVRGERARHRPGSSTASHTRAAAGRSIRRPGPPPPSPRSRLVGVAVTSPGRLGAPGPRSRAAVGWAQRKGEAGQALTARCAAAAAAAAALASPPCRAPGCS
ncbi:proapoptotic nucleolar protein 1 [Eumetopias jubatus]|uniref:proapoptotic nucleolar protein 1 n=1 Tax=Eumetopias jubatus TaxID=34886 RepID=UPI00101683B3|nr:proapoptotic nucleolar protein 1 [Eumetopias jubatus]